MLQTETESTGLASLDAYIALRCKLAAEQAAEQAKAKFVADRLAMPPPPPRPVIIRTESPADDRELENQRFRDERKRSPSPPKRDRSSSRGRRRSRSPSRNRGDDRYLNALHTTLRDVMSKLMRGRVPEDQFEKLDREVRSVLSRTRRYAKRLPFGTRALATKVANKFFTQNRRLLEKTPVIIQVNVRHPDPNTPNLTFGFKSTKEITTMVWVNDMAMEFFADELRESKKHVELCGIPLHQLFANMFISENSQDLFAFSQLHGRGYGPNIARRMETAYHIVYEQVQVIIQDGEASASKIKRSRSRSRSRSPSPPKGKGSRDA